MSDFVEFVGNFLKAIFFSVIALCMAVVVFAIMAIVGIGLYEMFDPTSAKEFNEKQKRDAIPHVYSEVDGCTIYTWKDNGYWHYMTKCPTTVTTEGHHGKMVGKITKDVAETIVTKKGE